MTEKPESRLQRRIHEELEAVFGGYWRKIHGSKFQHAGIPDLLGCEGGLFFGLEVKTPDGGPPTKVQESDLLEITESGGVSAVVESPKEAVAVVHRALAKARRSR